MTHTIMSSDKMSYVRCLKYANICGTILIICILLIIFGTTITCPKTIFIINLYMIILALIGALLLYSLAAFCFYSKRVGFKFIFNREYLFILGGIYPNISREKIYYSEFSNVYLDVEYTLFLYTESERILAEISLNTGKDKIKQILLEFQKRGKSVKTAPELYGLYSIVGENIYGG